MSTPPSSAGPTVGAKASKRTGLSRPKVIFGVMVGIVALVAAILGVRHLRFVLAHEQTDDAEIEGHVSPVLPRVPGYVASVFVQDNQHVDAGQALVAIDPAELDLHIAAADAALKSAQAGVQSAEAALANARAADAVARANVVTAEVTRAKAASDLARDTTLYKNAAISNSQLTDTQAAADEAQARLVALRRQVDAAVAQVAAAQTQIAAEHAAGQQRQSDLDYARLQRSYASVVAPIAGVVSRKDVEPGQFVQAGQTLLSIASDADVWIVANFKETQVARMHPGQSVDFKVDAYGSTIFHGQVQSIAGATGAHFALLPPDNASGNFVKVTQRVPVKIALAGAPDPQHVLRPGMSVDVAVSLQD
jgi:membrane fusion protein (multidrug efflux system)